MKERFQGDGQPDLIAALLRQEFVLGNVELAAALAERGDLMEFVKGDRIILEDAEDDNIFLIVAGSAGIVVKGGEVGTRQAGQHVGEMAAIGE